MHSFSVKLLSAQKSDAAVTFTAAIMWSFNQISTSSAAKLILSVIRIRDAAVTSRHQARANNVDALQHPLLTVLLCSTLLFLASNFLMLSDHRCTPSLSTPP
jgi:hypothetical protein